MTHISEVVPEIERIDEGLLASDDGSHRCPICSERVEMLEEPIAWAPTSRRNSFVK